MYREWACVDGINNEINQYFTIYDITQILILIVQWESDAFLAFHVRNSTHGVQVEKTEFDQPWYFIFPWWRFLLDTHNTCIGKAWFISFILLRKKYAWNALICLRSEAFEIQSKKEIIQTNKESRKQADV